MLKDSVVLIVICLIVVGGIAAWLTHPAAGSLSATPEVQQPVPTPTPPPVARVEKKARKPVIEAQPAAVEPAPAPEPVVVEAAVQQHDPHDPPPFPAVEQIATGAHEAAITGKYGDPALSAVTSRDGHMIQTLVYARGDGRPATIIRIEDGRVAAAYSQSEPTAPSGFSAPRPSHSQ